MNWCAVAIAVLLCSCAGGGVKAATEAREPARQAGEYAGRIVLHVPGDPLERGEQLARRVGMLGLRATVSLAGERAIVYVYGAPPVRLEAVAKALVGLPRYRLVVDGKRVRTALLMTRAATPECNCAAIAVVKVYPQLIEAPKEVGIAEVDGAPVPVRAEVELLHGRPTALALALTGEDGVVMRQIVDLSGYGFGGVKVEEVRPAGGGAAGAAGGADGTPTGGARPGEDGAP